MIPATADASRNETAREKTARRSPLEQLLHALNQPLTGLQCSMEVALAGPRTREQYVQGLREGLALTERMRALVEALREVAEVEPAPAGQPERTDVEDLLREAVEDLTPVAEEKDVRISLRISSASSLAANMARAQLAAAIFRLMDSALSLAARGTALRLEASCGPNEVWLRMEWQREEERERQIQRSPFSRPELGFLVAQARLERAGAIWERAGMEACENLMVRWPSIPSPTGNR